MLDDWYFYEHEAELKDAPWYYRPYFKQWGIYANSDFKGPWDPAYMHFLLTDESGCGVDGANIRNKRKEESDISPVASKHVSLRVKTKPISDVHLHVPHTIVTSSVVNRDESTPHHENVTSWWKGMSVKDEEAADGVKEKETSLEEQDDLKRMVDAEEDDEPPELIIRDDDSTISEEEPPYIYKHIGFSTDKCPLESWVESMIEACEEKIKKDRSDKKKRKRKKKKKKPKNWILIE